MDGRLRDSFPMVNLNAVQWLKIRYVFLNNYDECDSLAVRQPIVCGHFQSVQVTQRHRLNVLLSNPGVLTTI